MDPCRMCFLRMVHVPRLNFSMNFIPYNFEAKTLIYLYSSMMSVIANIGTHFRVHRHYIILMGYCAQKQNTDGQYSMH